MDRTEHTGWALALVLLATTCAATQSACDSRAPDKDRAQAPHRAPQSAEPAHVRWRKTIEVDRGPAIRGPWRMNDSKFHYVDDPTVDIADDGTVGVAWVDNRAQNVLFQTFDPQGRPLLEEPVDVSRSPEIFSWLPQIVVRGERAQHVYVLWQEIVFSGGTHGGEAFFARSTNGGESFESPVNLSQTQNGVGKGRLTEKIWHNGSLDLAMGPEGTLHAAWTAYQGPLRYRRSTDRGASFSKPRQLAGSDRRPARGPSLATGPEGAVYLSWTVGEDDGADLRIARSDDAGARFRDPRIPFETDGHSDAPDVEVDSEGRVHLVFAESPEGAFERYHVRYARTAGPSLRFDSSRRVSEADQYESANFPALAIDDRDRLYLLWERYPDHSAPPRGLGFTTSADRGDSFAAPTLVPGTANPELGFNGSLQGQLMQKLAVHGAGAVAVVNSRFDEGDASRVRLFLGDWSDAP